MRTASETQDIKKEVQPPPMPVTTRPNLRDVPSGIRRSFDKNQSAVGFNAQRGTIWYSDAFDSPQLHDDSFLPPPSSLPPTLAKDPPPVPKNRPNTKAPPTPLPRRVEQVPRGDDSINSNQEGLARDLDIEGINPLPTIPPRPTIPSRPAPLMPTRNGHPPQPSPCSFPQPAPPTIPARVAPPPAIPPRQNLGS